MPTSPRSPIGLFADFSGAAAAPLTERVWRQVDRDSIDEVIRASNPVALLGLPYCRSLRITAWRDFHPDQIVERVPSLKALLYARAEVSNLAAMRRHLDEAGASVEIESHSATANPVPEERRPREGPHDPSSDGDLLDSILGDPAATAPSSRRAASSFDRMISAIIAESTSSTDFAREDARRAAIDEELSRRVRAIVHHPNFKSLETSWSSARSIVRAGDRVPILLFDLRLMDVVSDAALPEAEQSLLRTIAVRSSEGDQDQKFSFIVAGLALTDDADGANAFRQLSRLAHACGASLVADICPTVMREERLPREEWLALIKGDGSSHVAIAYPPVLSRLPYGQATDPVDEFPFEEFEGEAQREDYLWRSAALSIGASLASFFDSGAAFGEIDSLPIHVYRAQGVAQSVGPVFELLHESRIKQLNDAGITCLVGMHGGDCAQVVGLRAVTGERLLEP